MILPSWPVLPIFSWLERTGDIDPDDMYSTFNMGIGYVLVVAQSDADAVIEWLADKGEKAYRIGAITEGTGRIRFKG